jgi:ABC-type nitrate/sulfonate/bicarbonate transport system ATPase subunit
VGVTQPTAVALEDATAAFRLADARVYTAVEQASLSVEDGEFVAIVGPTGCGEVDAAQCRHRPAAARLRYGADFSGGQRKRIGLAQVLIRDPRILLMDGPFGPLEAQTRQIMGNLLLEPWNADRKAVLSSPAISKRRSR